MAPSAVDRVIYLHGFRSSPASAKGRELAAAAAEWNADFSAPDLNLSPREADALVGSLLSPLSAQARRCTLLAGSSLGGFYALRAARAYGCPTAVVNPCLMPWDFVPQQVGL
ncbi:YqiA/YcfP family alpha/beta fold hydrolase, partial [Sutterella wadsworthensis]